MPVALDAWQDVANLIELRRTRPRSSRSDPLLRRRAAVQGWERGVISRRVLRAASERVIEASRSTASRASPPPVRYRSAKIGAPMWSALLLLACAHTVPAAPFDTALADAAPPPGAPALGVPAYFYPGPLWGRLGAARPAIVIANPNSGPGAAVDPAYTSVIGAARGAGSEVIGYVSTVYGRRPIATVEAEIDAWYTMYDLDGIFLDEGPDATDCGALTAHYQRLADRVRGHDPGARVVMNPGTDTCASYLGFISTLMVFEDTAARFAAWTAPAWMAAFPPERFWILTLNTPANRLSAVVSRAASQGVGYVYATNDRLPNPWDTLPPYWAQEAALTAP
jgi:hypothetical protein